MVISPFAKVNFVDHTVTDQSSILRFIEDNWNLGRIGDNSTDAIAGSLMGMFQFQNPAAKAVILNPTTGQIVAAQTTGVKAVANPKGLITAWFQAELDGTQSTSPNPPLSYQWSVSPFSPQAAIVGANSANPIVSLNSGPGGYSFTLVVTDASGNQSTDTATIILQ